MQCHEFSKPFPLQWLVLLHPWAIDHSELFLYCKCVSWSLLHALHKHPGSLFTSWSLYKALLSWLNSLPQRLSLLLAKPSQHKNEDVSNSTKAQFPTRGCELCLLRCSPQKYLGSRHLAFGSHCQSSPGSQGLNWFFIFKHTGCILKAQRKANNIK